MLNTNNPEFRMQLFSSIFFFQLKSLFEIFTFVSEKNIKYQYLILASLILEACYRNSVSRFSTIQLRLINKFNTDFESYFKSVSNFRLVCLLPVYFRFWPPCWEIWKKKCFFNINIIYGIILLFNTTEITYTLFSKLIYPENI